MLSNLLTQLAYANGLFNIKNGKPVNFTQNPTLVSKKLFLEIKNLQRRLQILYYRLSLDLKSFSFEDDMYKFLSSIISTRKKPIKSFYLRSDYLLDGDIYKQVEINMISQCFSIFGPIVNRIHALINNNTEISDSDVKFIDYLETLKNEYERVFKTKDTCIAMVDNDTSPSSSNFLEKMKIIEMCKKRGMAVLHVKIDEIAFSKHKAIHKKSSRDISIVYYRWFYNYDHYDSDSKDIRKKIEDSDAISLPSAEFQIVNSKAFQKILADENTLQRYTDDPKEILRHFGEFKDVSEDTVPQENWILKDVEEGGGHLNKSISKSSFLMKKFNSPSTPSKFIEDLETRMIISEVSIFGGLISVDGEIVYNEECGYMVRSKDANSLEGGVCIGAGGLDSLVLLE
ncbi:Glutathione synthetase [Nosema granulosis]|uniref:glutathione synthase n=1 Tax=Nosema granulosis TaxID=83296 RepID=A0A9P6H3I8_9MICR|nr:Glutathione synthetase [Nosema granulosis]